MDAVLSCQALPFASVNLPGPGDKQRKSGSEGLGSKVQSILLTTGAHLSTDTIELASAHNIDLVFLSRHGDPYARIWQARMGSTAAIRRRRIEVADGPEGLAFVRDWVQAKLRHQTDFLDEPGCRVGSRKVPISTNSHGNHARSFGFGLDLAPPLPLNSTACSLAFVGFHIPNNRHGPVGTIPVLRSGRVEVAS